MVSSLAAKQAHSNEAKRSDDDNGDKNTRPWDIQRLKVVHNSASDDLHWDHSAHFNQVDMISQDRQRAINIKTLLWKDPIAAPIILSSIRG